MINCLNSEGCALPSWCPVAGKCCKDEIDLATSNIELMEAIHKPKVIQGDGKGAQHREHNVRWLGATATMNVEQALNQALSENLTDVIVIGYSPEGTLTIRSSRMSRAEALWLAERARLWALEGGL